MKATLQILLYAITLILVGVLVWFMKPVEIIPGEVIHDTLSIPADSNSIILSATKGKIIGTEAELIAKYGKIVRGWNIKDSLNIIDSLHIDTVHYSIPTLFATDTFRYSGFDLLNDDTAKVKLNVRTTALALLEPVNAIEIKTVIEDLTISVPPRPDPSSSELAYKYWKELGLFGLIMFMLGLLR